MAKTWEQLFTLLSNDKLAELRAEAVLQAVVRFAEAQKPEEERLLALMRLVRFRAGMRRKFFEQTVRPCPLLNTPAGSRLLLDAFALAFFDMAEHRCRTQEVHSL